jgi:Rrf2 family protein
MKITAQEEYGLRCLLRLARARRDEPLTIPEIAEAEQLSVPYVAKLLSVLRQAGLIESVRGRAGGYRLAQEPSAIRLGPVLRALGEPLFDDAYCEQHAGPEIAGPCIHQDGCTIRALWQTLEQWVRHVLDGVRLSDLLESEGHLTRLLHENLQTAPPELLTPLITLTARSHG